MAYRTSKPSEVLTVPQVDAVIALLMHHIGPEVRAVLMAQCPVAYHRLTGRHPSVREAVLAEVAKAMDAGENHGP